VNVRRGLCAALVAWGVMSVAPDARADATDLVWEAPEGCPTESDLERSVARLRAGRASPTRPVQARGRVRREPGGPARLRLSISTADADTERELEADACEELLDAAALLIVLAAETAAQVPASTLAAPRAPAEQSSSPEPRRDAEPKTAAPEASPLGLDVRVFGAMDAAALPRPAPGLGAGASVALGPVRAEAYGAYFPDQTRLVEEAGAGADVSFVLAAARVCWVPLRRRVDLAACLGGEAGVLRAQAFGVSDPSGGSATWLAPQIAGVGRLHLSPIVASLLSVELAVPVAKERFVLVGVGDVHGAPDLTARVALGFEIGP